MNFLVLASWLWLTAYAGEDHGTIIIKFDQACLKKLNQTVADSVIETFKRRHPRHHARNVSPCVNVTALEQLLDDELETQATILEDRKVNGRRLQSVDHHEAEALAALHLIASTFVVGSDKVRDLIKYERERKASKVVDTLKTSNILGLTDKTFDSLMAIAEEYPNSHQMITIPESLDYLDGMKLVKNPALGRRIIDLANLLPCLSFPAAPDLELPGPIDENQPAVAPMRSAEEAESIVEVDVLDRGTLDLRLKEEKANGRQSPSFTTKPDYQRVRLTYPNDTEISKQWHLKTWRAATPAGADIDSGWAYLLKEVAYAKNPHLVNEAEITLDFATLLDAETAHLGMPVAIVDGGCAQNPDLINMFWRNPTYPGCTPESTLNPVDEYNDCIGFDFGSMTSNPTSGRPVDLKHGTSCGAIAAGQSSNNFGIAGVCPQCQVVCVKINDSRGIMMASYELKAINYLIYRKFRLSSHSYGAYVVDYPPLRAAYKSLEEAGHLVIAAAGNENCDTDNDAAEQTCKTQEQSYQPAGLSASSDNIISVGASMEDGSKAEFSNWGKKSVTVFAPGVDIVIPNLDGWTTGKGTSYAAPMVSGMVALLWSRHPNLTPKQVKEILTESASPLGRLHDVSVGGGVASLSRALAYAEPYDPIATTTPATTYSDITLSTGSATGSGTVAPSGSETAAPASSTTGSETATTRSPNVFTTTTPSGASASLRLGVTTPLLLSAVLFKVQ